MKSFEDVLDQEKKELTEALILFGEGKRVNKAIVDLERNRPEFYKFYQAGQKSKQAEIDSLKTQLAKVVSGEYVIVPRESTGVMIDKGEW